MIAIAPPAGHRFRVALARVHQRIGMAGALGCLVVVLALAILALAWRGHRAAMAEPPHASPNSAAGMRAAPAAAIRATRRVLPDAADLPLLLSRIERAAMASGLGWPRADYRINPASDDTPASAEVRCTLKGPYPALRSFVTALLQDTPTLTLKEFALSRASADDPEVEAKLAIGVYIGNSAAPTGGVRP